MRTDRPTDALTTKVVTKWRGFDFGVFFRKYGDELPSMFQLFNGDSIDYRIPSGGYILKGPSTYFKHDPRDDTDTALELLVYLTLHHDLEVSLDYAYSTQLSYWSCVITLGDEDEGFAEEEVCLPISGPAFRYAVIHLAAKLMEIEE